MALLNDASEDDFVASIKYGDIVTLAVKVLPESSGIHGDHATGYIWGCGYSQDTLNVSERSNEDMSKCLFKIFPQHHYPATEKIEEMRRRGVPLSDDDTLHFYDSLSKERAHNETEIKLRQGTEVRYGDTVQLLHVRSSKFVSSNDRKVADQEPTNLQVKLLSGYGSHNCWLKIRPRYEGIRGRTDRVEVSDHAHFEFIDRPGEYLHRSSESFSMKGSSENVDESAYEVNCSSSSTSWAVNLFRSFEAKDKAFVGGGTIVRLFHKPSLSFLAAVEEQSVESDDEEEEDEPHSSETSNVATKSLENVDNDDSKSRPTTDGSGVKDNVSVVNRWHVGWTKALKRFEREESDDADEVHSDIPMCNSHGLWIVENLEAHEGNYIKWTKPFRLRHASSSLYLCVTTPHSSSDNVGGGESKSSPRRVRFDLIRGTRNDVRTTFTFVTTHKGQERTVGRIVRDGTSLYLRSAMTKSAKESKKIWAARLANTSSKSGKYEDEDEDEDEVKGGDGDGGGVFLRFASNPVPEDAFHLKALRGKPLGQVQECLSLAMTFRSLEAEFDATTCGNLSSLYDFWSERMCRCLLRLCHFCCGDGGDGDGDEGVKKASRVAMSGRASIAIDQMVTHQLRVEIMSVAEDHAKPTAQRYIREFDIIGTTMNILEALKRADFAAIDRGDFSNRMDKEQMMKALYHFIRLAVANNRESQRHGARLLSRMADHLADKVGAINTVTKIVRNNRELLAKSVRSRSIRRSLSLIRKQGIKSWEQLKYLNSLCECNGEAVPENQKRVYNVLLVENPDLLIDIKFLDDDGKGRGYPPMLWHNQLVTERQVRKFAKDETRGKVLGSELLTRCPDVGFFCTFTRDGFKKSTFVHYFGSNEVSMVSFFKKGANEKTLSFGDKVQIINAISHFDGQLGTVQSINHEHFQIAMDIGGTQMTFKRHHLKFAGKGAGGEKRRETAHHKMKAKLRVRKYLYHQLKLYVSLCRDRNYFAIDHLQKKIPYTTLLATLTASTNTRMKHQLYRLMRVLYIDTSPQRLLALPTLCRTARDDDAYRLRVRAVTKHILDDDFGDEDEVGDGVGSKSPRKGARSRANSSARNLLGNRVSQRFRSAVTRSMAFARSSNRVHDIQRHNAGDMDGSLQDLERFFHDDNRLRFAALDPNRFALLQVILKKEIMRWKLNQDMDAEHENKLLRSIIILVGSLVDFGFYENVDELETLVSRIAKIMDCRTDLGHSDDMSRSGIQKAKRGALSTLLTTVSRNDITASSTVRTRARVDAALESDIYNSVIVIVTLISLPGAFVTFPSSLDESIAIVFTIDVAFRAFSMGFSAYMHDWLCLIEFITTLLAWMAYLFAVYDVEYNSAMNVVIMMRAFRLSRMVATYNIKRKRAFKGAIDRYCTTMTFKGRKNYSLVSLNTRNYELAKCKRSMVALMRKMLLLRREIWLRNVTAETWQSKRYSRVFLSVMQADNLRMSQRKALPFQTLVVLRNKKRLADAFIELAIFGDSELTAQSILMVVDLFRQRQYFLQDLKNTDFLAKRRRSHFLDLETRWIPRIARLIGRFEVWSEEKDRRAAMLHHLKTAFDHIVSKCFLEDEEIAYQNFDRVMQRALLRLDCGQIIYRVMSIPFPSIAAVDSRGPPLLTRNDTFVKDTRKGDMVADIQRFANRLSIALMSGENVLAQKVFKDSRFENADVHSQWFIDRLLEKNRLRAVPSCADVLACVFENNLEYAKDGMVSQMLKKIVSRVFYFVDEYKRVNAYGASVSLERAFGPLRVARALFEPLRSLTVVNGIPIKENQLRIIRLLTSTAGVVSSSQNANSVNMVQTFKRMRDKLHATYVTSSSSPSSKKCDESDDNDNDDTHDEGQKKEEVDFLLGLVLVLGSCCQGTMNLSEATCQKIFPYKQILEILTRENLPSRVRFSMLYFFQNVYVESSTPVHDLLRDGNMHLLLRRLSRESASNLACLSSSNLARSLSQSEAMDCVEQSRLLAEPKDAHNSICRSLEAQIDNATKMVRSDHHNLGGSWGLAGLVCGGKRVQTLAQFARWNESGATTDPESKREDRVGSNRGTYACLLLRHVTIPLVYQFVTRYKSDLRDLRSLASINDKSNDFLEELAIFSEQSRAIREKLVRFSRQHVNASTRRYANALVVELSDLNREIESSLPNLSADANALLDRGIAVNLRGGTSSSSLSGGAGDHDESTNKLSHKWEVGVVNDLAVKVEGSEGGAGKGGKKNKEDEQEGEESARSVLELIDEEFDGFVDLLVDPKRNCARKHVFLQEIVRYVRSSIVSVPSENSNSGDRIFDIGAQSADAEVVERALFLLCRLAKERNLSSRRVLDPRDRKRKTLLDGDDLMEWCAKERKSIHEVLLKIGVLELGLTLCARGISRSVQESAIDLMCHFLRGPLRCDVRDRIAEYLSSGSSASFFRGIHWMIYDSKTLFSQLYNLSRLSRRAIDTDTLGLGNLSDDDPWGFKVFSFLRLLCDEHHDRNQAILRVQNNEGSSINLYNIAASYLAELTCTLDALDLKLPADERDRDCFRPNSAADVAIEILGFLREAVEGPCWENQKMFASTQSSILIACSRCLDFAWGRPGAFTDDDVAISDNSTGTRLVRAVFLFLNGMLDGRAGMRTDDKIVRDAIVNALDFSHLERRLFYHRTALLRQRNDVPRAYASVRNFVGGISDTLAAAVDLIADSDDGEGKERSINSEAFWIGQLVALLSTGRKKCLVDDNLISWLKLQRVRIVWKGSVEDLYFQTPEILRSVSVGNACRNFLDHDVSSTETDEKLQQLIDFGNEFNEESKWQEQLRKKHLRGLFDLRLLALTKVLSYYLVIVLNMALLISEVYMRDDPFFRGEPKLTSRTFFWGTQFEPNAYIYVMSIFECALLTYNVAFHFVVQLPTYVMKSDSNVVKYLFEDSMVMWNVAMMTTAILGTFYWHALLPLLLLDHVPNDPALLNVVYAVGTVWKTLVKTFWLLCILLYIAAYIQFETFPTDFAGHECQELWTCTFSYFNFGIRNGGGIGESLYEWDLLTHKSEWLSRGLFDIIFFIIVNVFMLNLVFGIIIDNFADLRDQRKTRDDDKENTCFICGKNRAEFSRAHLSFEEHKRHDHHLPTYLRFIVYLKTKNAKDLTGLEDYVLTCVNTNDLSWLPIQHVVAMDGRTQSGATSKSGCIPCNDGSSSSGELRRRVAAIEKSIATVVESLETLKGISEQRTRKKRIVRF